MQRIFACLLLVVLFLNVLPVVGNAVEGAGNIVYFDDGSYMTVEIITNDARVSGSKTGIKQYTYYDVDGVSQWKAALTGSFTYTGSSATCTSSSVSVTIYDSSWYEIYKLASKSGNVAKASVTMGDKLVGGTVTEVPVNLTLTCDVNGNLS